ncbi:MAG: PAS domain S-box protein, partial [Terrimicrobiaceae bacterium]
MTPAKGGGARTPRVKALVECDGWDFLPVVLWKISSEGVILRANLASDELLGYEPLEFLGRKLDDFLVDSIDFKSFSKRIGLIPKAASLQVCLRCKDGSTRDVAIDANRVADGSGGEVIHCAVADQSVQRRTEGFAREQAEFFTKSTEALLIQDPSGSITFWSQGAERLYGVASKDAIGRHMLDLPAFDKTQAAAARKAVLANGEWSGAMRNFTASGNEIAVESRWVLLRDREGRSQSIVVINDDAADAKLMEEDRLRAQRQECIGTLAGGIAHDLNNILQPISIALDLFRSRLSDDESQEMLQLVDSNLR